MICGHTLDEPLYSNVPLSCVPPMRLFCGFFGSTDRLWNCRVLSPLFRSASWFGTRQRSDLQYAVSAAFRPRESHLDETSANLPSEIWMPPSSPTMNCDGLPGTVTSACWSGCMASAWFGSPSWVRSLQVAPASVDSSTARPLSRPCRLL